MAWSDGLIDRARSIRNSVNISAANLKKENEVRIQGEYDWITIREIG